MKNGFLVLVLIFLSFSSFGANLLGINFQQKDERSYLDFLFDSEKAEVSRYHIVEDKQIVVDIKGVKATERVLRAFDTSEFSGSVVFVSAYQKPDVEDEVRVVLQLRDNVRSKLQNQGKRAVLVVENRFGVFNQEAGPEKDFVVNPVVSKKIERINVPKSDSVSDILENLTLSGQKKYIGKKITVNIKNMKVSDVLEMIADASGFNIIQTDAIGKLKPLTLNLVNIPWDQVLDTVLKLNDLVAEKNGSILTIKTLAQATRERQEKERANEVKVKAEPLVTKIFPVSYAKAGELVKILGDYVTEGRGKISIDERTNAIIAKDVQGAIQKMEKILKYLDTQTPQVLIESKIVEVFENYAREIGLTDGINFGYDPVGTIPTSRSVVGQDAGQGIGGPGFSFSSAPTTGDNARNLLGLTVGRFGRLFNLNFQLQLLESEAKGKVVASPRVVTKHNQAASLTSSDTTSFAKKEGVGVDQTTTFEDKTATLNLSVTPLVTNDGAIDLKIDIQKDSFGTRPSPDAPPNKASRKISTSVLVDNGSTIVLGGLYNYEKRESHSGIPFLKDIPLVGWLFRTPYNPETSKQELVIFITPRIVNQEKAGLTSSI
jgi:type IV pilus assembly protein PilQ